MMSTLVVGCQIALRASCQPYDVALPYKGASALHNRILRGGPSFVTLSVCNLRVCKYVAVCSNMLVRTIRHK